VVADRLVLSGDIDRAVLAALKYGLRVFIARTQGDVALYCADVSSIDSDGVRASQGIVIGASTI
jgi:ABC-type transporter Mla MlaB component